MRTLARLTWVEIKLFTREPITITFTFALPLIFLFVMGGVFGNTPDPEGAIYRGVGPMNYYVPAYIGLVIAAIGVVALPVHLTGYRERGVFRRFRASAISVWSLFGSQLIVSFIIAISGAVLLTIFALIVYDVELPKEPVLLLAAFILSTLSFAALGTLIGIAMPTTRAAQGIGIILFFVMMILAGAGPPPEVLTDTMRLIADITPLRYVILLLQDPWLGFGWNVKSFVVVTGVTGVATILATRFFKWE